MVLTDENAVEIFTTSNKNYNNVIVSLFCVGIIIFILFTQCKVSNIKLQMKDASLILIFIALLAYINGYEKLFILLLAVFVLVYFIPQKYFENFLSPLIGKKEQKEKIQKRELKNTFTEETNEKTDNEITIDVDIDIDIEEPIDEEFDGIVDSEENVMEVIKKKID